MEHTRAYVVVVETSGGREAPPHVLQIVDAYDCVEAAKQLMLETQGRYGCEMISVLYCRPWTLHTVRRAVEILAEEGLRRMPSEGMVA